MDALIEELKAEILKTLNIVDVAPEEIGADDPLFGDGLGLDSIDSLELIVLLERNYGIKIDNPEEGRAVFNSLRSLAEFILEKQKA